mmetsp:Transcript_13872/g.21878  ORF Transcript_13872/g.21878 Transcript_13872/m.21878 type:complete len:269 (-) Transcript_13872:105-911(-)
MLAADEGSLFEVLYSGRHGTPPNPLFIDRDPQLFVYVLRFLREMSAGQKASTPQTLQMPVDAVSAAFEEAKFFKLTSMTTALEHFIPSNEDASGLQLLFDVIKGMHEDMTEQKWRVTCQIMLAKLASSKVQVRGCYLLRSFLVSVPKKISPDLPELVRAVVDAAERHDGNMEVQEACWAAAAEMLVLGCMDDCNFEKTVGPLCSAVLRPQLQEASRQVRAAAFQSASASRSAGLQHAEEHARICSSSASCDRCDLWREWLSFKQEVGF